MFTLSYFMRGDLAIPFKTPVKFSLDCMPDSLKWRVDCPELDITTLVIGAIYEGGLVLADAITTLYDVYVFCDVEELADDASRLRMSLVDRIDFDEMCDEDREVVKRLIWGD